MGQSLKVYICWFKVLQGKVYTMGQSLKVYICGLQYYRTGLHYGTTFKGVYLWFTVLQDRFTLWDNV